MIDDTVVLAGGTVVDGTGAPPVDADVILVGDTIARIAGPSTLGGARRVDCSGLIVCPGFIDLHTHSDLSRLRYPGSETRILQGITTEIVGNCGMSAFPVTTDVTRTRAVISTIDVCPDVKIDWSDVEGYLERLNSLPAATNVAVIQGHGTLRDAVAAAHYDPAGADGIAEMVRLLRRSFQAGVVGLSLGLMYAPGELAQPEELTALATVVAEADALLTVHLRSYASERLGDAVRELVDTSEQTAVRLQVSHLRSLGDVNCAGITRALNALESTSADVQADIYPYLAGHTTAQQLFPADVRSLGPSYLVSTARDNPDPIIEHLRRTIADPSLVVLAKSSRQQLVGLTLADAAVRTGTNWASLLVDLVIEASGAVDVIVVGSTTEDMMAALEHPRVAIASDGMALGLDHTANLSHPRSIGTFPRSIRALIDIGWPVEKAVYKATGQPAARLGISDRGQIRAGAKADIVVFDPSNLRDCADYAKPLTPPRGISTVFVNGQQVVEDGRVTGLLPGRLLRQPR